MANLKLLWRNQSDKGVLSGGNWEPLLPVSNLQNKELSSVARSVDATLNSTKIVIDLGANNNNMYTTIGLLSHNLSPESSIKATVSNDVNFSYVSHDTGWAPVYIHDIDSLSNFWEAENYWSGKPTQSDINGYTKNKVFELGGIYLDRYIKIEISDTSNSSGFIEVGRLMVSPDKEFRVNMSYGASVSWQDKSTVSTSLGGVDYFDKRPMNRVFSCATEFMEDEEALENIFEMQKQLGITGEIFVIPDADDNKYSFRNSFLARMESLSAITKYTHGLNKTNYKFKELL